MAEREQDLKGDSQSTASVPVDIWAFWDWENPFDGIPTNIPRINVPPIETDLFQTDLSAVLGREAGKLKSAIDKADADEIVILSQEVK